MKKIGKLIFLTTFLVLLDQYTKSLATRYLMGTEGIPIIEGIFRLKYLENRGAAFGMLQNQLLFFVFMTILVLAIFGYFYYKIPANRRYMPLEYNTILLLAGAIGNFIDRITKNFVVDFLYFELIDFPIFNIADCYVVVATFIFGILILFYYKEEEFEFFMPKKKEKMRK